MQALSCGQHSKRTAMRKRFEQQTTLGKLLIEDVKIPTKKRLGALPELFASLREIYITPKWNKKVFEIMEKHIYPTNNHTGRPGMNLWMIFVLAQIRNCKNISYDELHYLSNYDSLTRKMLGVAVDYRFIDDSDEHKEEEEFSYQSILDNVGLLSDEAIKEINQVIVSFGHEVFKKKRGGGIALKNR